MLRVSNTVPVSTAENERFESLEAFRGIAALMVVIFHAYQTSRIVVAYVYQGTLIHILLRSLDSGVSVFLALSGFLIFLPFARALIGDRPRQSARAFLIRRAIRIMPLYFIAILLIWTLRYTGGAEQWLDLLEHLTFTQIFDSRHIFWTIGPAWSLAVEVLFYLAVALSVPLLARVCARLDTPVGRTRLLLGLVASLFVISLLYKGWAFYLARLPETDYAVYYGFLAKADLFALGMFLAVGVAAARERLHLTSWQPAAVRLAGLGLFILVFFLRERSSFINLYFHTLCGIAFSLWLASTVLEERNSLWKQMLAHPVFKFLGLISYSVYIWHEPIMLGLARLNLLVFQTPAAFPWSTLAFLVIVILSASLSYYLIEYPTQFLRHLFTREGHLADRYSDR
jgi:peptidoglycan/LPS O-acetylase OafA/YrhL